MTTPCVNHPGFLQPGEDPDWHTTPTAQDAIRLCHRKCPIPLEDCARQALTAGTLEGHTRQRVANGVIAAGIVCNGNFETLKALTEIAYPDGDAPESLVDEDEFCEICTRDFVDTAVPTTPTTAHRATPSSPLCRGCYTAAGRQGNVIPLRAPIPERCNGCEEPMTTRSRPREGHVRHEKDGFCASCNRAARRAALKEVA